jgi:hypothetical protein
MIKFKQWDEIKDIIPYHNSDNVIFCMRNRIDDNYVARLRLVLKYARDTSPKEMIFESAYGNRQMLFTEENYKSICDEIDGLVTDYLTKISNDYTVNSFHYYD